MQISIYWRKFGTVLLVAAASLFLGGFLAGCNDFLTKDLILGVAPDDTDTDDGDGGGDSGTVDTPDDDDSDGLGNEVEEVFEIDPITSDTDQDGFGDGLEFVVDSGDPLDGSLTPVSLSRELLIDESEALSNDPDSDQDGLGNTFETDNSLDESNPDTDGDGYQDGLELVAGSDPFDDGSRPTRSTAPINDGIDRSGTTAPADSDLDGVADSIEAVNGTESNSRDSDGDGFSDGIEFLMGSNPVSNTSIPNFIVPVPDDDDPA